MESPITNGNENPIRKWKFNSKIEIKIHLDIVKKIHEKIHENNKIWEITKIDKWRIKKSYRGFSPYATFGTWKKSH